MRDGPARPPDAAASIRAEARPAPRWRQRLHEVIFESDTRAGRAFDLALLVAIVASVLAVVLESVPDVSEHDAPDGSTTEIAAMQPPPPSSFGSVSVDDFREADYLPEAIMNFVALLGWAPDGETTIMGREAIYRKRMVTWQELGVSV